MWNDIKVVFKYHFYREFDMAWEKKTMGHKNSNILDKAFLRALFSPQTTKVDLKAQFPKSSSPYICGPGPNYLKNLCLLQTPTCLG